MSNHQVSDEEIDDLLGSIENVIESGKGSKNTRRKSDSVKNKLNTLFNERNGKVCL